MRFRFRSSHRDEKADLARVGALKTAASAAISSASSESVGLKRRISELRDSLAGALGDEDGIYFHREAEAEKELALLEQELLRAERRAHTLDRQLQILGQINQLLDKIPTDPETFGQRELSVQTTPLGQPFPHP